MQRSSEIQLPNNIGADKFQTTFSSNIVHILTIKPPALPFFPITALPNQMPTAFQYQENNPARYTAIV